MAKGQSEGVALGPFTRYALDVQGFDRLDDVEKRALERVLRFSPAVCAALVIAGTVSQWPLWQLTLGGLAMIAFIFPRGHAVDAVFNLGVKPFLGAANLPANPRPRRFACFIVGLVVTGSALGFLMEVPVAGLLLGGALAAVLALNAATNWCLGAWMYRLLRLPA